MNNLAEVAHFTDPEEAYVANAFLNARGIKTVIQNHHHLTTAPYLRVGLGGYRILCFYSDAERARRDLSDIKVYSKEEMAAKSEEQASVRKKNWFWLPVALFTATPFLPRYRSARVFAIQAAIALLILSGFFWIRFFILN